MSTKPERTIVFLHQVEKNQPFYCSPREKRAWTKLCPARPLASRFGSLPVERRGIKTHVNAMAHVWINAERWAF
jgi:hypothetical protein